MKAKQKRVPLAEIKIGLQVVVSEAPDTQLYTIKETDRGGRYVHLVYDCGEREASGGWLDFGSCMYPTLGQLKHNAA